MSGKIYRAPHLRQLVAADPFGKYNCSAYALARAVDAATLGGVKVTGRTVRALSSEPVPDPSSPGLNIGQLVTVSKLLRVPVVDRTGGEWDDVVAVLDVVGPGRRVIAQLDYETLGAHRCQGGGNFGHAMTLDAHRRIHDGVEMLGSDPLCTGLRWYPASVIRKAMLAFAESTGLTGGRLRWAVTREIPLIAA